MPGRLFVLARVPNQGGWQLAGAALSPAEAGDVVTAMLAAQPTARIVIANAVRSFKSTVITSEDATVTVDP